jgi:hypothetical protein
MARQRIGRSKIPSADAGSPPGAPVRDVRADRVLRTHVEVNRRVRYMIGDLRRVQRLHFRDLDDLTRVLIGSLDIHSQQFELDLPAGRLRGRRNSPHGECSRADRARAVPFRVPHLCVRNLASMAHHTDRDTAFTKACWQTPYLRSERGNFAVGWRQCSRPTCRSLPRLCSSRERGGRWHRVQTTAARSAIDRARVGERIPPSVGRRA